ncbi:hypothetical protein Ndes2526B_g06775 [Nannochloris sp. 'desiccata']
MSLNFDFSQLDKLPEGTTAKKGPKFQPKFLAKPRAGPSFAPQATLGKPSPTAQPASQPTAAPAQKQQQAAAAVPSTSKPSAAPVQLGIPSKRQPEQPTQVELQKPEATATTRAPKRPRKQAQPLPAAAEFPGGLAIEPETTSAERRPNATNAAIEDGGIEQTYERLRPASSLSARAQARQDAALNPRKRGRPRKTIATATQEGDEEQNAATTQAVGTTRRSIRKSMGTSTTQPSRFRTEAEREKAGIRRPSRSRRDYDKNNIIDDALLYEMASSSEEESEQEVGDAGQYFIYKGTYEVGDEEVGGDRAGPSNTTGRKQPHKQRARAGVDQRKSRKTPRKGDPLSTYKTKLKKIGDEKSKRKVSSLADQALDPQNWSMKKIVKWAGSRERKLKAEERKVRIERQKKVAADLAAGGTGAIGGEGGGHGDGEAGISADAQQQHPNRGDGAGSIGGTGRGGSQAALASPFPSGAALPAGASALGGTVPLASQQPQQQQQQQLPRNANLAPQVQVVDGRIVVNRQSLTVEAQEREQYTRIVTEDMNRLNSMSYTNRISNERWTTEDTELFYKALSQFGTDFTLISHLFPGRERRHLKNKYTRENKIHPDRIDEAMNQSSNGTINSYNDMIVMLKESGMAVGAGAAEAAGVASPSAPAAAAVLNGIPSPSSAGVGARSRVVRRGGNDTNVTAAPLAITEAGEPASQDDDDEEEEDDEAAEAAAAVPAADRGRGGRKKEARTATTN